MGKIQPDWYLKYKSESKEERAFSGKSISKAEIQSPKIHSKSRTVRRFSDLPELLTVTEVAEYLKRDVSYVYKLIRRGLILGRIEGKRGIRIEVPTLMRYLENGRVVGQA